MNTSATSPPWPLGDGDGQADCLQLSDATLFVYVKIPAAANIVDPVHKLEDKIDQLLRDADIGSVIGWGDSMGDVKPDGSRVVEFERIDIEITDLAAARIALQSLLPVLGVTTGTEIHYTIDGIVLMDVCSPSGWLVEQPAESPSGPTDVAEG